MILVCDSVWMYLPNPFSGGCPPSYGLNITTVLLVYGFGIE